MIFSNRFQQLSTIAGITLGAGILITGCSTTNNSLSSQNLVAAETGKPLQQQIPLGERPQQPALPQPALDPIPAPARVHQPPATYIEGEKPDGLWMPEFEIPGPAGKRKRGQGHPIQDQINLNTEEPVPNSWVSSSSNFNSISFNDNALETGGYVFIPPDSHAAAGPDHVVNVVNAAVAFHTKDGSQIFRDSLKDFFYFGASDPRNPETFTFDPKVIFDQYAQRFLITTLEHTETANGDAADTSRIFLAVSDDDDPTGTWYITVWDAKTNIDGADRWADYPGFAVDDQAVYIAANMFGFVATAGAFGGNRVWIIDKGLSGGFYDNGAASVSIYDPAEGFIPTTQQPAHMFGTSPFGTDAGTFLIAASGLTNGTDEFLQIISIDDPLGASTGPAFIGQFMNLGNIDNLSADLTDAAQLGSATAIEVNDRRALNAVWRDDKLWVATTINPNAGADAGQTTAYWVKLNTGGSPPSVTSIADQGTIGGEDIATGTYTFFPSIAVNENGDAAIGFSASAPTIYPGAYFVTREPGDASGTTSASQVVKSGVDSYVRTFGGDRNRWGDYSGAAVDPANGCLWLYNEWADTKSTGSGSDNGQWGTAYTKTCSCAPTGKPVVQNEWTMFSLACSLGQEDQYNTVEDLFPDLDPADYGDPDTSSGTWVVFEYDASNQAYTGKALADPLEEGAGYWFKTSLSGISIANTGMKLSGSDIPLVTDSNGRMNLVGHPHATSTPWADVKVWNGIAELSLDQADPDVEGTLACDHNPPDSSCTMSRKMYQWNGAAYQVYDGQTPGQEGSLAALDALWVEAFTTASLRIPETPASSAPLSRTAATTLRATNTEEPSVAASSNVKPFVKSKDWALRLIASSGHLEDPGNLLGQLENSVAGKDVHDLEEPEPFDSTYLSIVFPHEDWEGHEWGYTTDFHGTSRKPEGEWEFSVKSSSDVSEVTLRWEGPKDILREAKLVDLNTGKTIRLGRADDYTFTMKGNEHPFRIKVR